LAVLTGWNIPPSYLAVDYVICPGQRLVSVSFAGILSVRGIETYAIALRGDPRFDPRFAELVNLRQVEQIDLQPEHLVDLADQIDCFARESRRAFVVGTEAQKHCARMHQLLLGGRMNIEIFASLDEA
jgi:hypothetical protein